MSIAFNRKILKRLGHLSLTIRYQSQCLYFTVSLYYSTSLAGILYSDCVSIWNSSSSGIKIRIGRVPIFSTVLSSITIGLIHNPVSACLPSPRYFNGYALPSFWRWLGRKIKFWVMSFVWSCSKIFLIFLKVRHFYFSQKKKT